MPEQYQVTIEVETAFVPDQSAPDQRRFAFAYTITLQNTGEVAVKLLSRHWLITDGNGNVQEVDGDGVVGEQPHLAPGEGFRYSSGAMLETPVGAMEGKYRMQADDGNEFDAPIPAFTLAVPNIVH
jgi:ApaG protein